MTHLRPDGLEALHLLVLAHALVVQLVDVLTDLHERCGGGMGV